ncbi:transposase domain-containing protein [Yoonia sp. SS1-5]|uniref:Transposase domain-containing protein n=1 Tax=Yoonia rhodophyticola TaxID=3137370 RepID=A0AAN0NM91_9RHOB
MIKEQSRGVQMAEVCRKLALGRKNYRVVGSPDGGRAGAAAYALIETAELNGVDPYTWRADTMARIPDDKITGVNDFLPWVSGKVIQ